MQHNFPETNAYCQSARKMTKMRFHCKVLGSFGLLFIRMGLEKTKHLIYICIYFSTSYDTNLFSYVKQVVEAVLPCFHDHIVEYFRFAISQELIG